MSESALPEDLSRWPQNSYELLGVVPGVSERDLRRAYTRLIRTWKPEQFPEHFKRIRDAYELALRYNSYFGSAMSEEEPAPSDSVEELPARSPLPAPADDLDELWQLGLDGGAATAYARYVELHQRQPGRTDITLRLYWLLALDRSLDQRQVPCDWLVQGLVSNGAAGPLRELYLRELAQNPAEATSPRCDRVLALPMAAPRLADLAEARWKALAKLGAWDRLADEIEALRERIAPDDERAWLRLLVSISDHVAWAEAPAADEVLICCRSEIKLLEHLAIHAPDEFDRLDALFQSATGWRALKRVTSLPPTLLQLIPPSWTQLFAEIRPLLERTISELSLDPLRWLGYLTRVKEKSSPVLAQFGRLLDELQESREWQPPRPDSSETFELARQFFATASESYDKLRKPMLEFCLKEAVQPELLAALIVDKPAGWPAWVIPLAHQVADDWPLRYVFQAWALFWA
jgi:hypothetical protein